MSYWNKVETILFRRGFSVTSSNIFSWVLLPLTKGVNSYRYGDSFQTIGFPDLLNPTEEGTGRNVKEDPVVLKTC